MHNFLHAKMNVYNFLRNVLFCFVLYSVKILFSNLTMINISNKHVDKFMIIQWGDVISVSLTYSRCIHLWWQTHANYYQWCVKWWPQISHSRVLHLEYTSNIWKNSWLSLAVTDLHSKILDAPFPSRSNILHFHAVFKKFWPNDRLPSATPPPSWGWGLHLGNLGFAMPLLTASRHFGVVLYL